MGMEAAAGSDLVVITSDNPRTEDPMEIIQQVEEGVRAQGFTPCGGQLVAHPPASQSYRVLPDRREAIAWALKHLHPCDILLVAGKGHETYQEINGVRRPFDDRQVVREELSKLKAAPCRDLSVNHPTRRTKEAKCS
jgi:UDP-N-acetylmuramoyl-L-alanyl-D-glutamate--2,6-diaminopimelate ligase